MAKPQQVIVINPPNELVFRGPFDEIVSSRLVLFNPTSSRVCFKVKTTAPRRYCVRPNSGVIDPDSSVTVMLMLQPFEFDPNEKNKHKFMVQTMVAPEGEINLDTLFKEALPNQVMDSKLRCVFDMPIKEGEPTDTANTVQDSKSAETTGAPEVISLSPPKTTTEAHPVNELKKAADEIKNLRSENGSLKQEILTLKEETMRVKMAARSGGSAGPAMISLPDQSQAYTSTHLIIAFAIAFVSFIVGKWIL